MGPTITAYAWAAPAVWTTSPFDHTWVTSYDIALNPFTDIAKVVQARQYFWYCWGSFHWQGKSLGRLDGDLDLASCLVRPNVDCKTDPAARGTIFKYGWNGVCHQLANQVFYATRIPGRDPFTVKNARGYSESSYIYGDYGKPIEPFLDKVGVCSGATPVVIADAGGGEGMASLPDDFEARARKVLSAEPKKLEDLLALRAAAHAVVMQGWSGTPSAEELNARNQTLIDQAAALLGPKDFEALFGIPPGTKIDMIDPSQLEADR